jgi:AbrB family looped-hinge helix DNA binding protein
MPYWNLSEIPRKVGKIFTRYAMLVKVSTKGQITLPKDLRQSLGIEPGSSVMISRRDDVLVLRPVTETLFDLIGSIPVEGSQDFALIREEIRQYVAEKAMEPLQNPNE